MGRDRRLSWWALIGLGVAVGGFLFGDRQASAGEEPTADAAANSDLVPFKEEEKFGVQDAAGKIVVKPIYDDVKVLSNGLIAVNVGASIQDFGNLWALGGGDWGIIDRQGKQIVPIECGYIGDFCEGLALIHGPKTQQYIDATGKVVIDLGGRNGGDFSEGLTPVREYRPKTKDYRTAYLDKQGREVIAVVGRGQEFHDGMAVVGIKPEKPEPDIDPEQELWGYIDRTGKMVIPARFHQVEPFSEGLAAVRPKTTKVFGKGDLWGYIDKSGKYVLEPQFNDALPFEKGVAQVHVGGTAAVSFHRFLHWEGGQWRLIDRSGKKLKELREEDVQGLSPWR